jgi:hypothetical protein
MPIRLRQVRNAGSWILQAQKKPASSQAQAGAVALAEFINAPAS